MIPTEQLNRATDSTKPKLSDMLGAWKEAIAKAKELEEPTEAELIADAKRWAAKIMPDGTPRSEARYVLAVNGWYIRGNDGCAIDPILMEIDRYEPSEDAAWLALGKLLARLREELET